MTLKRTIGGDRLGSGKRMKVDMHGFGRSTHDLGSIWRSSMASGTLVPFMSELALPGDTFDIDLDIDIMTHPTIGPLLGSYKVQLDVFVAPIDLYIAELHNNQLEIGLNMEDVKLPQIELTANTNVPPTDVSQINPSCIFRYLGISGIGTSSEGVLEEGSIKRKFNAVPWIAYWDIYKNYYANKQEKIGAVIHTNPGLITPINSINICDTVEVPAGCVEINHLTPGVNKTIQEGTDLVIAHDAGQTPAISSILINSVIGWVEPDLFWDTRTENMYDVTYTGVRPEALELWVNQWTYNDGGVIPTSPPQVTTFELSGIDEMRKLLQTTYDGVVLDNLTNIEPYNMALVQNNQNNTSITETQEGLGLKTYNADLFNNWMATDWINTINTISAVNTAAGSFTIDALNIANKVYMMLNRIAISGGTYDDYIETSYDVNLYKRCTTPIYQGSLIRELAFQELTSTTAAETTNGKQPLGQLAGKGVLTQKKKGGYININVDRASYIMGIVSITPRIDYSQGNKWDTQLANMADLHVPGLDEIGFQDQITDQMAYWDTKVNPTTGAITYMSAGKQPAWINYMTNVNETKGNFAIQDNEMFMTLNRRYERNGQFGPIQDLTTYIDPSKFNYIFAETQLDAQNFWVQIKKDITARRKMSGKIMPNL